MVFDSTSSPLAPHRRRHRTSFAAGVRSRSKSSFISSVRRTNGGSRYAAPLASNPSAAKVSQNSAKAPSKQSCDVPHDDVSGSYLAKVLLGVLDHRPLRSPVNASTLSGDGDVLAGEAACDEVNSRRLSSGPSNRRKPSFPCPSPPVAAVGAGHKARCGKGLHVVCKQDIWPVLARGRAGSRGRSHRRRRFAFRLARARG